MRLVWFCFSFNIWQNKGWTDIWFRHLVVVGKVWKHQALLSVLDLWIFFNISLDLSTCLYRVLICYSAPGSFLVLGSQPLTCHTSFLLLFTFLSYLEIGFVETHQKIVPPEFSRQLRSTEVPEGTQHVFECHVSGIPSPSISWYKNDDNIDSSPDYVITQINGTCCVKFRKTLPEHSGKYTCKATNNGGEVTSSAKLNVISKRRLSPRSLSLCLSVWSSWHALTNSLVFIHAALCGGI